MIVKTATGSKYEVTNTTLRRLNQGEQSLPLRKDDQTLEVTMWIAMPEVGREMVALLAGVNNDPNISTLRRTSTVTEIEGALS